MKTSESKFQWKRWIAKPVLIITASILGVLLMTYLGGVVFQSHQSAIAFGTAIQGWFWILFSFRVAVYIALYWKSQAIFERFLGRERLGGIDFTSSQYRHMLLRVVVVYEVIFPFDLIGILSGGSV